MKVDDDVVFIDVSHFSTFIRNRIAHPDHILAFPSIVNNGMCAFHQQQRGLLPVDALTDFPYDTLCGKLWGDGHLAQRVHEYFCDTAASRYLPMSRSMENEFCEIPIGNRISINCFAILSEHLWAFQWIDAEDERELTVRLTEELKVQHYIDMSMVVCHLAFYQQRLTGLDEVSVIDRYTKLVDEINGGV
jgi:hypothetical protein